MRRNGVLSLRGRGLREQYDAAQPLSDRLARLLSKVEPPNSGSEAADAPHGQRDFADPDRRAGPRLCGRRFSDSLA